MEPWKITDMWTQRLRRRGRRRRWNTYDGLHITARSLLLRTATNLYYLLNDILRSTTFYFYYIVLHVSTVYPVLLLMLLLLLTPQPPQILQTPQPPPPPTTTTITQHANDWDCDHTNANNLVNWTVAAMIVTLLSCLIQLFLKITKYRKIA